MGGFTICALSGSLRRGSFNTAALRAAQELAPSGVSIDIAEIGDLPLYNDDLRPEGSYPPAAQRLRAQMQAADALLFASPEYNYSVSGPLKNAIDWASRAPNQPFDNKAVGIVGAATSVLGTARSQFDLRKIVSGLNAYCVNVPHVFIASAPQKFDAEGRLTDETARKLIAQLLEGMVELARKLKA